MEARTAIQVDAVDVDALIEEVLNAVDVATAGKEEELHGGVEILGDGEIDFVFIVVGGAAADGVKGRLPAEAEAQVIPSRVQRRLATKLATQVPPQRPRRELPRYPSLQLRRDVLHV